ncbi:hypothetical protein QYE76_070822 [Lolium multiflorum]|uniref:RING-type domain-containing protein n=1 Tax=Lolium multiflorum TaxID=4521 RepID=A0AAD8SIW9_LOLMU|nr:hypothetical protein QYE76_070822 [Lolium multiflorum]
MPEPAAAETREVGCAVCQKDFEEDDDLTRMPCSHSFHKHCIFLWLRISRACPCAASSRCSPSTNSVSWMRIEEAAGADPGSGSKSSLSFCCDDEMVALLLEDEQAFDNDLR